MTGDSFAPKTLYYSSFKPVVYGGYGNTLRSVGTSPAVVRHIHPHTRRHFRSYGCPWTHVRVARIGKWKSAVEPSGLQTEAVIPQGSSYLTFSELPLPFCIGDRVPPVQPMCSIEAFKAAEDPYFCFSTSSSLSSVQASFLFYFF